VPDDNIQKVDIRLNIRGFMSRNKMAFNFQNKQCFQFNLYFEAVALCKSSIESKPYTSGFKLKWLLLLFFLIVCAWFSSLSIVEIRNKINTSPIYILILIK